MERVERLLTRAGPAPLRIAVLASWAHPIAEPLAGGLESHVWHLCRGLTARGHHVTLHARAGSDPAIAAVLRHFDDAWTPTAQARADASMPSDAFLREHHAYLDAVTQLDSGRVDVVHNHAYHYLPLTLGGQDGPPWVSTLHTPPTPWLESALAARREGAMRFTTVSAHTAAQWSRLPYPPTVVANGVDPAQWPSGPGGDDLVWSGRLTPEKAPHLALLAARETGRRIVLAGPISDEAYFARKIRPHLGADADYAGHLRQAELADLVGHSAVALVTPLWDEPFGLVAAEALTCGTPVAAFAAGGLPEVLGQLGRPHLAPAGDVAALAVAVERAATADRTLVRADASRRLGLSRMISSYEHIYANLAELRRAAPRLIGADRADIPAAARGTTRGEAGCA